MNVKYNSLITAKNVGIISILCAATATIIILNQPSKKRLKKKKHKQLALEIELNSSKLTAIKHDLESRRQKILNEFEESNHKKIPKEMDLAMDYIINDICNPSLYPASIRLLASQLIQDYTIMYTNINSCEPSPKIILLAKEWLNFNCNNNQISLQIEQINHRYALALRSKSIKEFKILFNWLQSMKKNIILKESIKQNWILRNFQCCCLLGKWNEVLMYGKQLENIKPESLSSISNNNNSSNNNNTSNNNPLHPLHLFEYIALKLPNQSANFTQVYYNVNDYIKKFDPVLSPPLKFTEWQIKNCKTIITFGFSTNHKRHEELLNQIKKAKLNSYSYSNLNLTSSNSNSNTNSFMFVYGCLVQFPCFWVQLPASNTKMQPVVLTGPYNDSEMELTASYIRRVPQQQQKQKQNANKIRVVRSDLRLKLDRSTPFYDEKNNDNNIDDEIINKKNKKWNGWNWNGTFEHEEGLLECYESDLNNFEFRRNFDWKLNAMKFTCREWDCHMIITTPD